MRRYCLKHRYCPKHRYSLHILILCLPLVVACTQPAPETGTATSEPVIEPTEILWDEWGVPHIYAPDTAGLFYANGWAQARAHGDLLLQLLGQARGRGAEYWDEGYLEADRWVHLNGIPERAREWLADPDAASFNDAVEAFARGINDYAAEHADQIADEFEIVLPIEPADVLAHTLRTIHYAFVVAPWDIAGVERGWDAGSNAWAIAPSRSASGNAMLVANPHLPWSNFFTWFEVHLVSPEVDISGASLIGSLFVGIGFNDHLGWTHTVNTHDGYDVYELELAEGGYLWEGEVRAFDTETKTLKIKTEDGVREETLEIRRSVHGPVVAEKNGQALALRVVGLEEAGLLQQYWDMSRATNLEEFEAAQRRLQMPMFTTMYADRDGRIMHLFGGLTPKRAGGDWDHWSKPVPGIDASNLWTESHGYDELPKAVDPESGWLQNANDPPWTTTFPRALDPEAYPPYMAPRFMHFRAQQSALLLMDKEKISYDELVAMKHSNQMRLAERCLDDLAGAVEAHGSERARRAFTVLEAWDRTANRESRGGVLFAHLASKLLGVEWAEAWDWERPTQTPDGFAEPAAVAAALDEAAGEVEEAYGALDVPWGEVYRLRRGKIDLPANGGPGDLGIFRVVGYEKDGDDKFVASEGDSYVAVVEFSDPIRASVLLSYGNWSQPGSPHVGDQLELFARQELRPVWRTREDVEAHLKERETF